MKNTLYLVYMFLTSSSILFTQEESRDSIIREPFFLEKTECASPLPPRNFQGCVREDRFLTQVERYKYLSWDNSLSNDVKRYFLFKNGLKIAEISACESLCYVDKDYGKPAEYILVAVSNEGEESETVAFFF